MAQIEKLVDLPGIRELLELPLLSSVLAGFLPQLVLRLFFSLMPYILAALERLEGLPAESEVEFGVVRKYYAFQVRSAWPPCLAALPGSRSLKRLLGVSLMPHLLACLQRLEGRCQEASRG